MQRKSVPYLPIMLFRWSFLLLPGVLFLSACGGSQPKLPGFEAATWRRDAYGCQNLRQTQITTILQHKEQLYGTRTAAIEELLGRPDEEELAEQTEKIYNYYLESGPQCLPNHPRSGMNKLRIRFGSLGTVTEIMTDQPIRKIEL